MTAEPKLDLQWVYLDVYPAVPYRYLYKTLAMDWDKLTEEERQQELSDAALELGWLPDFTYQETKRADD